MSVAYEEKSFTRVGRQSGTKKVVKDAEGNDKEVYVDEAGNVIDNTYRAKQLKDDSIDRSSGPNLLNDLLEVAGGDLNKVAEYFLSGANHHLRLEAGGYTPEEKAAKALQKAMPTEFGSMSVSEIVSAIKLLKN